MAAAFNSATLIGVFRQQFILRLQVHYKDRDTRVIHMQQFKFICVAGAGQAIYVLILWQRRKVARQDRYCNYI